MKKMTFGEIIKQEREERRMSQAVLADKIRKQYKVRISTSYLSMIETNVRTNVTTNLINALLNYFELPLEAAHSLFIGCKQPAIYDDASTDTKIIHESQSHYSAKKRLNQTLKFDVKLPPEVEKPLQELYNLLAAKYSQP